MTDALDSDDHRPAASLWPIPIAVGVTLSEVGVLFGLRPVSVVGLLLFVGAMAALLRESGFVARPEYAIVIQGVLLLGAGIALVAVDVAGMTVRGESIVLAGAVSLLAIPLWLAYSRFR